MSEIEGVEALEQATSELKAAVARRKELEEKLREAIRLIEEQVKVSEDLEAELLGTTEKISGYKVNIRTLVKEL